MKPKPLPLASMAPPIHPATTGRLAIDAHSHVFNGTDLQVKEFIQHNLELPFPEALRKIAGEIVQFLTWHLAPSGCDEYHTLGELGRTAGLTDRDSNIEKLREQGYEKFRKEMQKTPAYQAGATTRLSKATDERSQYLQAIHMLMEAPTLSAHRARAVEMRTAEEQIDMAAVAALLDFLLHGFNYRFVNMLDYLDTYSGADASGRSIDMMVANLVDYDWALDCGGGTRTSFQDQIAVMERLSIFSLGRIHAMVPFDPMREVAEAAGKPPAHKGRHLPFSDLTDAILKRGCIGVKLYPVMGFKPRRNADLPANTWGKPWQPSWMGGPVTIGGVTKSFGAWMDDKLTELYQWCSDNDVPITLHADGSQGPDRSYDCFPFDESWTDVLTEFKELRVNFGHMANPTGISNLTCATDNALFPFMVGSSAGNRVYGDLSYPAGAVARPSEAATMLQQMFAQVPPGGRFDLHDRILYGTDWLMLLLEKNSKNCLKTMEEAFLRLDSTPHSGPSYADRFFALNAIEWLGLEQGGATRRRLEQFYRSGGIDLVKNPPRWMAKVDALTSATSQ